MNMPETLVLCSEPTLLNLTNSTFGHAGTICTAEGVAGDLHKAWRRVYGTIARDNTIPGRTYGRQVFNDVIHV